MSPDEPNEQPPSAEDATKRLQHRVLMENTFYQRGLYFLLAQVVLVIDYWVVVAAYSTLHEVLLPKALVAILGMGLSVSWCFVSRAQASRYQRAEAEIERAARKDSTLGDKRRALPSGFVVAVSVPVYVIPGCALVFWILMLNATCVGP